MKLERIPLERMKESVESSNTEKKTWQSVNRRLAEFRDSARVLFGFENPFRDRVAASSRESVLTAVAERGIQESIRSIEVEQLAKADRFLSSSLAADFDVPAGTYGFRVGEAGISFAFTGGSLESFANKLNDRGKDIVAARVVNDTTNSQVLLIEALKTGAENKLEFQEASLDLALRTGILQENIDASYTFDLSKNGVTALKQPLRDSLFSGPEQTLRFEPGADARLPLTKTLPPREGLELQIRYRIETDSEEYTPPAPPPGPDIASPGKINVDDITVENEPSKSMTPPWVPPEQPKRTSDGSVFSLQGDSATATLPEIQSTDGSFTLSVPLSEYMDRPRSLLVENNNTHRTIILESAAVIDPDARGDYKPGNAVDQARNAVIVLDGIRVNRGENTIDDVIPGVTFNLHGTSDTPVQLSVEPDRENIKNGIINFVGYYNQLLTDIHVLTRDDPSVIENLEYLTDEEVEKYEEKLGLFQGDITLNQLRSRLQRIMMEAYPAENSGDVVMLAQIGISTNASGTGAGINANRLRGYLEIDESALDQALETKIDEIQNLFGRDTDGDMVMDSGVAVAADQYIKPFSQSGGIIAVKMGTIDRQIERTEGNIETLSERLDRKQAELERDYGKMEGALESMEETTRAIDNLNNSGRQ